MEIRISEQLIHEDDQLPYDAIRSEFGGGTSSELAEKLDQEKRMLLTRREREAVERLVSNIGCRLNTQLKLSHV